MKLLVSPENIEEVEIALRGGVDIIDVKNPAEGSLGANFPWVIAEANKVINGRKMLSATIGDFDYKPGTAALAALGAAVSGANYIKVGLYGVKTAEQALTLLDKVNRAAKWKNPENKVVAAAYADYIRIGSFPAEQLPAVGKKAGVDGVMLDTGIKDGKTTFEFLDKDTLSKFVSDGHAHGLFVALAGSLGFSHLATLKEIGPDIIGVRGCVCKTGSRDSCIDEGQVRLLKKMIDDV